MNTRLVRQLHESVLSQIERHSSRDWNRQTDPKGEIRSKTKIFRTELGHISLIAVERNDEVAVEVVDNQSYIGGQHVRYEAVDLHRLGRPARQVTFEVYDYGADKRRAMESAEVEEMARLIQTLQQQPQTTDTAA